MDNLKIKIKDTDLNIPVGLLVGILVIAVGLFLMVFQGISFNEIWQWIIKAWRDFKR